MPTPAEIKRIREAVAGRDSSIPRREAMQLLLALDIADKHRDFESVLRDEDEDPRFRGLASVNLGRLGSEQAAHSLIAATDTSEPTVLSLIMRALGRIGGPDALPAIGLVVQRTSGASQRQARFAAVLIAHRFNLPGHAARAPAESDYLPLPQLPAAPARPIGIAAASPAEIETAVAALSRQPVGITPSKQQGWTLRCGNFEWMLLVGQEFEAPDALHALVQRRAVPAIVSLKSEEDGAHRPALTVLTVPGSVPGTVDILVHTLAGRVAYASSATFVEGRLRFSIRSVRGGATLPVVVTGFYDGQVFQAEAETVASVHDMGLEPELLRIPGT
jgi:hypothetical protein